MSACSRNVTTPLRTFSKRCSITLVFKKSILRPCSVRPFYGHSWGANPNKRATHEDNVIQLFKNTGVNNSAVSEYVMSLTWAFLRTLIRGHLEDMLNEALCLCHAFMWPPRCLNVDSVFPTRTNWEFSHNNSWTWFNQNPTFMILEKQTEISTLESPALIRAACVSYQLFFPY